MTHIQCEKIHPYSTIYMRYTDILYFSFLLLYKQRIYIIPIYTVHPSLVHLVSSVIPYAIQHSVQSCIDIDDHAKFRSYMVGVGCIGILGATPTKATMLYHQRDTAITGASCSIGYRHTEPSFGVPRGLCYIESQSRESDQ
jgi:hypothetical protein